MPSTATFPLKIDIFSIFDEEFLSFLPSSFYCISVTLSVLRQLLIYRPWSYFVTRQMYRRRPKFKKKSSSYTVVLGSYFFHQFHKEYHRYHTIPIYVLWVVTNITKFAFSEGWQLSLLGVLWGHGLCSWQQQQTYKMPKHQWKRQKNQEAFHGVFMVFPRSFQGQGPNRS